MHNPLQGTPVPTPEQAREILRRYNRSHFNLPGDKARYSIPVRHDWDDDVQMAAFINHAEKSIRELEEIRKLGEVYVRPSDWNCAKMGGQPTLEDCEVIDLSQMVADRVAEKIRVVPPDGPLTGEAAFAAAVAAGVPVRCVMEGGSFRIELTQPVSVHAAGGVVQVFHHAVQSGT